MSENPSALLDVPIVQTMSKVDIVESGAVTFELETTHYATQVKEVKFAARFSKKPTFMIALTEFAEDTGNPNNEMVDALNTVQCSFFDVTPSGAKVNVKIRLCKCSVEDKAQKNRVAVAWMALGNF